MPASPTATTAILAPIGRPSRLAYTFPHFMGYRYALFFYSTKTAGGRVDFDYYRVGQSGGSR